MIIQTKFCVLCFALSSKHHSLSKFILKRIGTKLPSSPHGLKSLKSNLTIYTEIQAFTNMDAVNR